MSFKAKLREQILRDRIDKISKNTSLDDIYKSMMVNALHNKLKVNS